MIDKFVAKFMEASPAIKDGLYAKPPESYESLVDRLIAVLGTDPDDKEYGKVPDPKRITVINHGDYQGTMLFIIGANDYQPSNYWSIKVDYGSCSGCGAFEAIGSCVDKPLTSQQVLDYWTLMLDMVQNMKEV
jgi:hypothetical protein